MKVKRAAVFGGAGKLGRRVVERLEARGIQVRALEHHSGVVGRAVEIIRGSITDEAAVDETVRGADVVVQLATTKEDPTTFFDVSLKGTFRVLEACRNAGVKQIILFGGDAAFGIWFYPQPLPIDEHHPYAAYPGYYAFSKVVEEVMAIQYTVQYGVPVTILRSSWVFDGDQILDHFSLLQNVNPAEEGHGLGQGNTEVSRLVEKGEDRIPVLIDATGSPLRRHVVHIDDVLQAFERCLGNSGAVGQSFNVAAPSPFAYDVAADYLSRKTGVPTIYLECPDYHSFEINITRARSVLGYSPENDIFRMIDRALAHRKEANADERV